MDNKDLTENNNKVLLDKAQLRIFTGLAIQREELQKLFQELIDTEREHIAMLVREYGLEEGEYIVQQEGKDIYLVRRDSKTS